MDCQHKRKGIDEVYANWSKDCGYCIYSSLEMPKKLQLYLGQSFACYIIGFQQLGTYSILSYFP